MNQQSLVKNPEKTKSGSGRKLTEADVLEIVARCQSGEAQATVARDFPVTRAMVGCIMNGTAWTHVTGIEPCKPGYARGQASGNAKLTRSQVLEIAARCKSGETQAAVARDLPVSKTMINRIMTGLNWSHVTGIKPYKPGHVRGEASRAAKLTRSQVQEIAQRCEAGEAYDSVARDFPVGPKQVGRIGRGEAWAHVTGIKRRKGRRRGEDAPSAKLTEADVLEIVSRYRAGQTQTRIARDFPVHSSQISNIVRRVASGHVTGIDSQ